MHVNSQHVRQQYRSCPLETDSKQILQSRQKDSVMTAPHWTRQTTAQPAETANTYCSNILFHNTTTPLLKPTAAITQRSVKNKLTLLYFCRGIISKSGSFSSASTSRKLQNSCTYFAEAKKPFLQEDAIRSQGVENIHTK